MKATVIGDGGWGTALAMVLHQNGHDVTIWGPFEENIQAVRDTGENAAFLSGVKLPGGLGWTSDRAEAIAGTELIVLATPSRYFGDVASSFAPLINPATPIVSVAKGLDEQTHARMTQVAEERLGFGPVAALSGPSHAEEVARGIPTAVTIACSDEARSLALQDAFRGERFRVYTTHDVVGVEFGGAFKNVIAIAVGIADGMGFGDNTRAALITRGLAEMMRLGSAMGASAATFTGLSGMGDLIVTCTSRHSRNRSVGERLGKGEKVDDILGGMKQVSEGIWNCKAVHDLATEYRVEVPIAEQVHRIVHEGLDPTDAVAALLSRDAKPEFHSHG